MSSADKIYVRMCDGHLLMKTPRQRGATGRSDCGDHAGRDVTPNYCCIAAVMDTSRPYYNAFQSHTVAIRTHLCSRPVAGLTDADLVVGDGKLLTYVISYAVRPVRKVRIGLLVNFPTPAFQQPHPL